MGMELAARTAHAAGRSFWKERPGLRTSVGSLSLWPPGMSFLNEPRHAAKAPWTSPGTPRGPSTRP